MSQVRGPLIPMLVGYPDYQEWQLPDGRCHRQDGPARMTQNYSDWMWLGRPHRVGAPFRTYTKSEGIRGLGPYALHGLPLTQAQVEQLGTVAVDFDSGHGLLKMYDPFEKLPESKYASRAFGLQFCLFTRIQVIGMTFKGKESWQRTFWEYVSRQPF